MGCAVGSSACSCGSACLLQVLPGLVADRSAGHKTLVLAQSEVTSEELAIERKVRT